MDQNLSENNNTKVTEISDPLEEPSNLPASQVEHDKSSRNIPTDRRKTSVSFGKFPSWLVYCVIIALVPLAAEALATGLFQRSFSNEKALSDLSAITIAIAGEYVGYTLLSTQVVPSLKKCAGTGGLLIIIGQALLLGDLSIGTPSNMSLAATISIGLFFGCLICGGICKWMENGE